MQQSRSEAKVVHSSNRKNEDAGERRTTKVNYPGWEAGEKRGMNASKV